jgi:hypothetical protein
MVHPRVIPVLENVPHRPVALVIISLQMARAAMGIQTQSVAHSEPIAWETPVGVQQYVMEACAKPQDVLLATI